MKKLQLIYILFLALITFSSCKETIKKENKPTEKNYVIEAKSTIINWTAYKTTNKVPVKGKFNSVTIESAKTASTITEALDGLKFNIPVSSIFTKDTVRDTKLKKFFFGSMNNTETISGTLAIINETTGAVTLTMNGISHDLPITFTIKDQTVTIESLMDLDNWKAQLALQALNAACKDLHSGEDGIPKTWNEVKIEVSTNLKYQ